MPMAMIEAYMERRAERVAEIKQIMVETTLAPHMDAGARQRMIESWRNEGHEKLRPTVGQLAMIGVRKIYVKRD